jgi:hypothetical protein
MNSTPSASSAPLVVDVGRERWMNSRYQAELADGSSAAIEVDAARLKVARVSGDHSNDTIA